MCSIGCFKLLIFSHPKLQLSKIVTPFPVFEENWDPNAVITMADDDGNTLHVKLLELLCFTRTRHKAKVADALVVPGFRT